MDPIAQLKADHREVEMLFAEFKRLAVRSDGSDAALADQGVRILEALTHHADIEESLVYPVIKSALADPLAVLEAVEEHHVARHLMRELQAMTPADERYEAKMLVLEGLVSHHVAEEEQELLPMARRVLAPSQLDELGLQIADAWDRRRRQAPQVNVTMVREYPVEQERKRS